MLGHQINLVKITIIQRVTIMNNDILYAIRVEDLQNEAIERIGRFLNEEEIISCKKFFDWGFNTAARDIIYNTFFTEEIKV